MPKGYGYPVGANDHWILNYMIHDLTPVATKVYITYNVDFIPSTAPAAKHMTPVHPIWMDVMDHHIYPVFNTAQHSGRNGEFVFPDMAHNPYGNGAPLNEFKVDHAGSLIAPPATSTPAACGTSSICCARATRPAPGSQGVSFRTRCGCSARTPTTSTSGGRSRGTWP